MKRQVFSSFWALEWYFLFCFWEKRLHFQCNMLCYLFMQENVQTNIKGKYLRTSRSQMFFKLACLKNFSVLSRRHLYWNLFLIKSYFSYLLCHCFVFLHYSIRISIPWLFHTYFHNEIFSNCNFCTHCNFVSSTILIESLKFRNNSRIKVTSPSNLCETVTMSFLNITPCYCFP